MTKYERYGLCVKWIDQKFVKWWHDILNESITAWLRNIMQMKD